MISPLRRVISKPRLVKGPSARRNFQSMVTGVPAFQMVVEFGLTTRTSSEGGTDWAEVNANATVEARSTNLVKYIVRRRKCVYEQVEG
jgi:hypothetical protein